MKNYWNVREKHLLKYINGILFVVLLIVLGIICGINLFHYTYKMNSDLAAEAILGKVMWESKAIIPDGWFFSTEGKFITAPNIAAIIYGITQNMNLSMGIACCIVTMIIILSIGFFMKSVETPYSYGMIAIILSLIIPSNLVIAELLYLFASYYGIHVAIMFFSLGVYNYLISGKGGRIAIFFTILFALLVGLQGTRGILLLYGPLLGIELIRCVWQKYRGSFSNNDIKVMVWVVAQLIVSYLATKSPVSIEQSISSNFRKGLEKLVSVVIPDFISSIGFSQVNGLRKWILGFFCLCIMLYVVEIIVTALKKKEISPVSWSFLVIAASPIVTAILVSFTTVDSSIRYYFLWQYAMVLAVVHFIRKMWSLRCMIGGSFAITLVIIYCITNIYSVYLPIYKDNGSMQNEEQVIEWLIANGYEKAYSSFEQSNKLTVISNGRVQVSPVDSIERLDALKWLSDRNWYPEESPQYEKTAYIFSEELQPEFQKFVDMHSDTIKCATKIDWYYIYISDYNYAVLE